MNLLNLLVTELFLEPFFNLLQATLQEKKKLEDELKALKEKNAEQQKFIGALKSAISHFS